MKFTRYFVRCSSKLIIKRQFGFRGRSFHERQMHIRHVFPIDDIGVEVKV